MSSRDLIVGDLGQHPGPNNLKRKLPDDGISSQSISSNSSNIRSSDETRVPGRKLPHDAYTVGWICALRSESNACRAMLDEEHDPLPSADKDDNNYLLGCMNGHNVVIATTGAGIYGTNAAAQTAAHMIRSFPNIRFGLLVGVGGGAPRSAHPDDAFQDIRLGDVVVSTPKGGSGGVLQYDMGKWKTSDDFSIEFHLNKPPTILAKAVERLQSDHDFGLGLMAQYIEKVAVLSRKLRNLKQYTFPGRNTDTLFKANYAHIDGDGCAACEVTQIEERLARDDDVPVVHYGLIASANSLMRSAEVRDKLRDAWGVLCFEMEAAGLMDNFPCTVIRGICDYSDTHKNKAWQPYAAVAAAAYAKDLLRVIQPQEVEPMESLGQILGTFSDAITATGESMRRMESKLIVKEDKNILNWLTETNYGPQQSDCFKRRQEGTGEWFIQLTEFKTWLEADNQTLFCQGIPGAGKTILTSIVINHLRNHFSQDANVGVAYIYCNFQLKSSQKLDELLASLLKQLSAGQPVLPDAVKDMYKRHEISHTRPSTSEIGKALQSVAAMYARVFIVLDALDECQAAERTRDKFLAEIFTLQSKNCINLFATSRKIHDICRQFEGCSMVEVLANDGDVQKYLHGHIQDLPSFIRNRPHLQEKVIKNITAAVRGMFLLAKLYLESLQDKLTVDLVNEAIDNIPIGSDALNEIYGITMDRIGSQLPGHRILALRALSWIVCAERPLSPLELQTALAVKQGDSKLNEDNFYDIEDIITVCSGLVIVDEESAAVRLAHYTTQEYLKDTQSKWFPEAQNTIAAACVSYLSFDTFADGLCRKELEYIVRLDQHCLYSYAALNWGHHCRHADSIVQGVAAFLDERAKLEASWQVYEVAQNSYGYWNLLVEHERSWTTTPLIIAAFFGMPKVVHLLCRNAQIHETDQRGRTPLIWAAENGHEAVVSLLLQNGADSNAKDHQGLTSLICAAQQDHESIVKLLLEDGADTESKDKKMGQTALIHAVRKGHLSIIWLLLKNNVRIESKDSERGKSPLGWAAEEGHEAVVKLLVESGADVNSRDKWDQTPLIYAIANNYKAIVQLLLETGADMEARDQEFGQTPLGMVAKRGYEADVRLLLAKGADIESRDTDFGQTALGWAAKKGHRAVVQLLLEHGAAVDSRDVELGRTALGWAAKQGQEPVVRLLLRNGADVESQDIWGQTALELATDANNYTIVSCLMRWVENHGAHAQPMEGMTPP